MPPAVDQIEVHPYLTQDDVRAFCAEHQIAVEGWSPIAQGEVLEDPTIREIAERVGKTPAQTVLRWHIERGDIIFPKSVTASRIRENFAIFDFELSGEDVEAISALNKNDRTGPDPDTFDSSRYGRRCGWACSPWETSSPRCGKWSPRWRGQPQHRAQGLPRPGA